MYFCTYSIDNETQTGIINPNSGKITPIHELLGPEVRDMNDVILKEYSLEDLKGKYSAYSGSHIGIDQVTLLAPIPYPLRDLICLGKNYKAHAEEIKDALGKSKEAPIQPIYFSKRVDRALGPDEPIIYPQGITDMLDYEVELAVIIGKECRNIKREEAEAYIFGYTIINDVSARDIQARHEQWFRGKSLDGFCPMGPYLVTKDEISFPPALKISLEVNDEVRQDANTQDMIFDIPHVLSELSQGMTLKKGDIIITGTPAGVGMGFSPPKYLKKGDIIRCEIQKLGQLINPVR